MTETEFSAGESLLDKFLNEITSTVLKCAIEKVGEYLDEGVDIDIEDENVLVGQLNQDIVQDPVLNDVVAVHQCYSELKSDLEEIGRDAVYAKCCKLIEDSFAEAYAEVNWILELNETRVTADIASLRKKRQLLHCIKNSDYLQNFFHNISVNIIQDVLDKIKVNSQGFPEDKPSINSVLASDIVYNINENQGNDIAVVACPKDYQNMAAVTTAQDYSAPFNISAAQNNGSLSKNGLDAEDSTVEMSFYSIKNESKSTDENSSGDTRFITADSLTFTTADEEMGKDQSSQDESAHVGHGNERLAHKSVRPDNTECSSTIRIQCEEDNLKVDKTLTDIVAEPRQSTPVEREDDLQDDPHHLLTAEDSTIALSDDSQRIINGESKSLNKSDHELQELTDDESSIGAPCSPATVSQLSSTFGNVTLEYDSEWEPGIQHFKEENKNNQRKEEKHAVILHELSFDERADLKAPELLGPVFLAVQDDDNEGNEYSSSTRKKLSQSIDDLCEMISDEAGQDLPLRRRAMSLETKKPSVKTQRQKVPTRQELMKAFQDLRNEILEDKGLDEVTEEEIEESEKSSKESARSVTEDKENERGGLPDPSRWQTIVYNGQHKVIDLKLIEPYMKVLTHGGYHHHSGKKTVIVVLTACNLPNKAMRRYPLLMEQLFFFIVNTMNILVTSEEYIFVYFHGGTDKNQSPSLSWLKKYYQYISRRLRKSVTRVYVVHPNLWLKSVFRLCRPFLSPNFTRKIKFVKTLKELSSYVKTDFIYIPDEVVRVDPDYKNVHASK